MIRVLIIEDEQSSAQRLKRLLEASAISCKVIGMVESNAEAKAFFAGEHPAIDLILSDIQLGDGLSFETLRCAPAHIPVIFTTAYDQYAVQAFKFNGLDYLLKPVEEADLQTALEKVGSARSETAATSTDAIARLLDTLGKGAIHYRERFLIPHKADEYLIVPSGDVSHIAIKDGVVVLYTHSGNAFPLGMTLEEAETQLDPRRFLRANRQYIINAAAVEKLSAWFQGKIRIFLKGYPDEEIIVSKDKATAVKRWLDS
ncbi:MAG: response regulator transcription factor [Bacteroidales bacterium]|nr:response regulator transcription factor [Bacteroidales bacterium]